MFALADVNSFYASCEKVFRSDLRNRPGVVLSNNDSCVIARSDEAKRLGIKNGIPWFQLKTAQFPEPVITFSSNYELYASEQGYVSSRGAGAALGAVQHRRDVSGYPRYRQLHRLLGLRPAAARACSLRYGADNRHQDGADQNAG